MLDSSANSQRFAPCVYNLSYYHTFRGLWGEVVSVGIHMGESKREKANVKMMHVESTSPRETGRGPFQVKSKHFFFKASTRDELCHICAVA